MTHPAPSILGTALLSMAFLACGDDAATGVGARPGSDADPVEPNPQTSQQSCGPLAAECSNRCTGSFENVECTGSLSGNFDNVTVPPGAHCMLDGALLTGNLIVEEGARAEVGPDVFVCGDLQGDQARSVTAAGTAVCGNLQFNEGGTALFGRELIVLSNFEVKKSTEAEAAGVRVCADAQFVENGRVSIPSGADFTVEQNCSADENGRLEVGGLTVLGDNDGCR